MGVTPTLIKELRQKTGAGMMDCKEALMESQGEMDKAIEFLRKKGLASAAKKASRKASEGLVSSYIHAGGKIGVLLEVNCETDFVAKTDEFHELVKNLCMQVAASSPGYVEKDEVPESEVEKEKAIYREQALASGKPEKFVEKIVDGKLKKYYEEVCLLEQDFIRDSGKKVKDIVTESVGKLGENIVVKRFARFVIGESL